MVVRGRLCCSLYKTQVKVCGGQLNVVDDDTSPYLWPNSPSFLRPKAIHQTLMTIAYLESNTEYHSKRTLLENWRNWN